MKKEDVIKQAKELGLSGELVQLSSVRNNPSNPRVIRDWRFDRLKRSISEFPKMMSLRPIVTDDDGVILGGNMRLRALQALGYASIPREWVKRASDLTEDEQRRFIAVDNESFGEWDMDMLANEWDTDELRDWGVDIPAWDDVQPDGFGDSEAEDIERKKKDFAEKMAAGELNEDDPEYQEFIDKFKPKTPTDECYTPDVVYDAVAEWVASEYNVSRANFVRPFYPGGDYQNERYKPTDIVVDNPPFSILTEIIRFYSEHNVRFFLFAPCASGLNVARYAKGITSICVGTSLVFENGATVSTSFITNLEGEYIAKSSPGLYKAMTEANKKVWAGLHRETPKYAYPDEVVTAAMLGRYSKYGVEYGVKSCECQYISELDAQKEADKGIYGGGLLVNDEKAAEKAAAEKAAAEKAAAEKAAAIVWELSEREREIVRRLNAAQKKLNITQKK